MLAKLLKRKDQISQASPGLPVESESRAPAREPGVRPDVAVPLLQSLISAGTIAGFFTFLISQVYPEEESLLEIWTGITLFLLPVFWLSLLSETRRLLWAFEQTFGVDLNQDGAIGEPDKRLLGVDVRDGSTHKYIWADWVGMDDENLLRFAQGLARGRSLTEGEWNGDPAFPKGINEFRRVRSRLLRAGVLEKEYPERSNSTYRLTAAGRAFIRRLTEEG